MSLEILKYKSVDQTLQNMYKIVNEFKDDPRMKVFANKSLKQIYNYISKTIPYVPDPVPGQVAFMQGDAVELLKSPIQTMFNGGDCDDKSILAACIFEVKKIPYRFCVVSTRKDKQLHHVYLEIFYNGVWAPFDATYPHYKIFWENPFTKKKIYEFSNNVLRSYDTPQASMNCQSCKSLCSLKGYSNYSSALLGNNGNAHNENISGVQLVLLRGADNQKCNCANCKTRKKSYSARDKKIILKGIANKYAVGLGVEPITAITTVLTVANGLFGGLFKKEAYQDAYNAWSQAERQLANLSAQSDAGDENALDLLSVNRALIAVLSKDYMNPPGANVCTSPGRCGNRAEWKVIQPEVENKVAAFAPMMKFINKEARRTKTVSMGLTDLINFYDQFKNKSGNWYSQYANSMTSQNKNNSGSKKLNFSGAGLLMLGGAVFLAIKLKNKK